MRLQGDMVREEVLRNVVRHLQGGKAQKTEIFALKTTLAAQQHTYKVDYFYWICPSTIP